MQMARSLVLRLNLVIITIGQCILNILQKWHLNESSDIVHNTLTWDGKPISQHRVALTREVRLETGSGEGLGEKATPPTFPAHNPLLIKF